MNAALYARVSTEEQANRDNSIPAQIRALREYCKRNNIDVYKEYIDEGISGQKENRPAFQQMLSDAYSGKIEIILVHKFDRFARKIELSRKVKAKLQKAHVNVISITEPIEDSPMGFFMEGLHELMAEYYIKNLSAEVKKGMNERATKGKHMGQMPYGYYCQNGNVYVNEEQAQVVRTIYNLYLQGYGQVKIAKYLNEHQIPTYSGAIGGWQSNQIRMTLRNQKYIGKNYWSGNLYDADFPSIVDEKTFYAVNKIVQIQGKKHDYRGDNFSKHHLLELLYCGECGCPMRIKLNHGRNGKTTDNYMCRDASLYRNGCTFTKMFNAAKLENDIEVYLKSILDGSILKVNIIKERPVDASDLTTKKLDKTVIELERVKRAYIEGVFELGEYKDLKESLKKQKMLLENELNQASAKPNEEILRKELKSKLRIAFDLYERTKTPNEKRIILKSIIKRIDVYRDKFEILFYV
jgi:site-specific DNA recombinase